MTARPSAPTRGIASIAGALIVTLGPLLWLCYALRRASYAALGRDQGIFQGTAWAIAHGAVLYRDLREINGPLVHEVHLLARLFGTDAHALRVLDLCVSALVFACFGAALPGATRPLATRRQGLERVAWAAAACVVLLAQYLAFYDYWHLTQRESFFDWFVLLGFACALRARTAMSAPRARAWLVLAGIASATPWFGKPLCVIYTLLHVAMFIVATQLTPLLKKQRAAAFGLGLGLGCALQLIFLVVFCDVGAFFRIYFVENPRYYFHIWPRFADDIIALSGHTEFYVPAIVLSLWTLGLIATKQLGRNVAALAVFPLAGIALDILQRKAFTYHLHPVTAGTAALALVVTASASDLLGDPRDPARGTWWPLLLASALAYYLAHALIASPYLHAGMAVDEADPNESPTSARLLAHYDTRSFSAVGLTDAGEFLKSHTRPTDRIQMYGMDPYLLALAERHSATPYIYAIDLNPDAVLDGIRKEGGSEQALGAARALASGHVRDLVARVLRANPAAFVFFDRAPFKHPVSAFEEFAAHVPELVPLVLRRYREAPRFGLLHVYLRDDRWALQQLIAPPR